MYLNTIIPILKNTDALKLLEAFGYMLLETRVKYKCKQNETSIGKHSEQSARNAHC